MSRSKFKSERTGEEYPRKTDKKRRTKSNDYPKFFGYRHGDRSDPQAVKGEDYICYGYPVECRHRETIKRHIEEEIGREELDEALNYNNAT